MKTVTHFLTALFISISAVSFSQENIDLLILNKNFDAALQQIENRIQNHPSAELYLKKGMVYNQLQNFGEAVIAFTSAQKLAPNQPEILQELAEAHAVLGNYHDALPHFESAYQLDTTNLQLAGKLGRNYINLKNYRKGYEVFDKIYQADSTNVYWNKQYAYCAYQTNKKEQAESLYEKVLELNPRDYSSYFNLMKLYAARKNYDKIFSIAEKGLEQFPGDPDFYLEMANFHFGLRNYENAMTEFENYYSADGDSVYKINLNYAISCYFAGDEQQSMKVLKSLYSLNPNDSFVLFYRSLCNKKLANYEMAEEFMEGAIDMSYPTYLPEMYHHLGQIRGQQRKFKESIEALKKAYELNPGAHEVLFEIATTYEEFNSNKTLALNYYQIYLKEGGEAAKNVNYALDRIERIKEDMFFEE
ncbi:MAG TPA: tetratricopeptide repeat protein [Tangfeifania sp.]|nr:tetratricopeptide repeat protein [Tangfeifania sp.]